MDDFKTVSDDKANLVGGVAYYGNIRINFHGHVTNTELIVTIDDANPLVNEDIVNGINNREVNKLKGNK